jgi:predicted Zn-dependent protease with MMP-like domain
VTSAEDLLDDASEALDAAGDDDEVALRATAKLVRAALDAARAEEEDELLDEAWELAAESIIAFAPAWPEKETLAALERDYGAEGAFPDYVGGLLAFYAGRWKDAATLLHRLEENAVAEHYRGCALERLGREKEADEALRAAAKLDAERFVKPSRMSEDAFGACVKEALAELPDEIRAAIEERCAIVVEDFPSDESVARGLDPLNLGEFRGADLGEVDAGGLPAEVVLYKKNLEKIAGTHDDLVEEIRITFFHELGHALGFEEDGVDDLGLA